MRRALVGFGVVAAALLIWWGRGAEQARSARPGSAEVPAAPEEPEPPDTEPAADAPAPEAPSIRPDPAERGECALVIRVINLETGRPVASSVDLWRLDAPGNEGWTAGDQLQCTVEVPAEGTTVEALPAGLYRPVCLAQRYSADDPPAFHVEGAMTEVAIPIEVPKNLHAYVKIVDPRGVPLPTGSLRGGFSRRWTTRARTPAWSKPRELRGGGPWVSLGGGGGGGGGTRSSFPKPVPQPTEGFRLGPFPEDSKKEEVRHLFMIQVEGCSEVLAVVPGTAEDGTTFVGLAVPLATVPGDLRMPDGRTIAEAGGKASATFTAVPFDASAPAPFLADRPFRIYVTVPGFKELAFEQRLGDPVSALVLEPAEQPPGR